LDIIVVKVAGTFQSSNFLLQDLKEIGEFLKDHSSLLKAS